MMTVRKSNERGYADHGWLQSRHTFSFGSYFEPKQTGFRSLRVMNEDRVGPGQGFGTHPHDNMEIVSYVLDGALQHKDSMGNGEVLRPGEFQRISAGSGITHSEFNPSREESVHFYQIWLKPNHLNVTPSYEQKSFDTERQLDQLQLVASPGGEQGSLSINQDARIYLSTATGSGDGLVYSLDADRHAWIQVLRGHLTIGKQALEAGDGASISGQSEIKVQGQTGAHWMLLDLA